MQNKVELEFLVAVWIGFSLKLVKGISLKWDSTRFIIDLVRFFVCTVAAGMLIVFSSGRPRALQLWARLAVSYLTAVAKDRTHTVVICR